MNSYDYLLLDLHFRMDAEMPFPSNTQSDLFQSAPDSTDIIISLRAAEQIPVPAGIPCPCSSELPVWRSGQEISRCSWDTFRPHMHFRTDYSLAHPDRYACLIREEYWPWATHSKYLWTGVMLNYILLHHRGLIFHASYIGYGGEGILFTAPSQTGKSTQARLWQQLRGARIINGDKAGVRLTRLPKVHGVPFSGTSGICENISLPLKAIVVLSQAAENVIRRLPPSQAVTALFPNLFVDRAIPEEWQLALQLLLDLVSTVPVYALACTPDEQAVVTLEKALYHHSHKETFG